MAPPPPPLPKMEGLQFLMDNTQKEESSSSSLLLLLDSPAKRKYYQDSHTGRQIQKAEADCAHLHKQLDASRQQWKDLQQQLARHKKSNNNPILIQMSKEQVQAKQQTVHAHSWHYNLCLANSLCPRQCQVYGRCWKWAGQSLGEDTMRNMMEHRHLGAVCKPEREMIMRCVGRHVASVVDDISALDYGDGGGGAVMDDNSIDTVSDLGPDWG